MATSCMVKVEFKPTAGFATLDILILHVTYVNQVFNTLTVADTGVFRWFARTPLNFTSNYFIFMWNFEKSWVNDQIDPPLQI